MIIYNSIIIYEIIVKWREIMAKKSNLMKDAMNMLKTAMSGDVKDKSADELMGMLGKLKGYVNELNQEMTENATDEVKAKYSKGVEALDNMITNGMENPGGDIDTTDLDEYIDIAKNSKTVKKMSKNK